MRLKNLLKNTRLCVSIITEREAMQKGKSPKNKQKTHPSESFIFSSRMAQFSIFQMSPNMPVACTSITEPLPTGKTAVRLFSCMNPNMYAKMTRLPEVFITVGTVIWSLS